MVIFWKRNGTKSREPLQKGARTASKRYSELQEDHAEDGCFSLPSSSRFFACCIRLAV